MCINCKVCKQVLKQTHIHIAMGCDTQNNPNLKAKKCKNIHSYRCGPTSINRSIYSLIPMQIACRFCSYALETNRWVWEKPEMPDGNYVRLCKCVSLWNVNGMSGCAARYTDRVHGWVGGWGSAPDASVCDETLKWVSVLTDKRLQLVNPQAPLDWKSNITCQRYFSKVLTEGALPGWTQTGDFSQI